jgi:hypothetical protein
LYPAETGQTKSASPPAGRSYTFLTATGGISGTGWATAPVNSGFTAQYTLAATNRLEAVSPSPSLATVTGRAWVEANTNGVRDTGELLKANVRVYLYDSFGALIAAALTDANGAYSFNGIPPGNYSLVFQNPVGEEGSYTFSPQDAGGDDTKDSDVNAFGQTAVFALLAGQTLTDVDAGLVPV